MEFYPPLDFQSVFDPTVNDRAIAKFGFVPKTHHASKKPITVIDQGYQTQAQQQYYAPAPFQAQQVYQHQQQYHQNQHQPQNLQQQQQAAIVRNSSNMDLMVDNAAQYFSALNKSKSFNINSGIPGYSNYQPFYNYNRYNYQQPGSYQPLERGLSKEKLNSLRDKYLQPKLLRKLGQNEKIFHGQSDIHRSYIYRSFIITSEINLSENIDLVNKAIYEWKKLHPLLRCRVLSKTNPENNTKEGYFAFAAEEKVRNVDNVKFLYYKSNSNRTCEDVWKLLVERECTLPLDGENGLLWRMSFLEIKNLSKPGNPNYVYAVILAFDHSIMDGRSSYVALLQLFAIIEDLHSSTYKRQKENPLLPSKEEIFKHKRNDHQPQTPRYYLQAPKFLDMENAIKTTYVPLKYLSHEEESSGVIYTHDHKPYVTVRELVNISKMSNSKFRTLVIHKTELAAILKKCKEHGVKLTSFLNMCLILALRMMYEKHDKIGNTNESNEDQLINYSINISLREFPEYQAYNPEKNSTIGCYIGLSFNSFGTPLRASGPNWTGEFWRVAKEESDEFHHKLDQGEFINSIHLPAKKREKQEFFYHFGNSNLGVLPSTLKGKKMIRVKQTFATSKYSKENFLCWFSNLIATIDNQMCWTISYNTSTIRQEVINMLIENLTKIIKELMI
jgi:hypothetical protein